MKKVGVLSLQGDFAAHGAALERAGAEPVYVREREQLDDIDGLILPGGESTTMLKLMRYEGLFEPVADFGRRKPVFGTCAGAILMAKEVSHPAQESFGLVDVAIERNAYGRQIDSRVAELDPAAEFQQRTSPGKLEAVFIRAPIIRHINGGVKVLAEYEGDPVLIEQGRHLVATFHPELTSDPRVHTLFLEKL
ncbi:MAG TPA: pyridoxal 5'-phosphate synthase glutaminase subunit PdxT [Verrucomicrobiae bacterium]|nr:pyridoxal 5'-phosphate synthase glutaminase subunit PdxT [Verrucomicrobiae bacterium]